VTGGYVGEDEAGERLMAVVKDEKCKKSGVYWSWNGNAKQVTLLSTLYTIYMCTAQSHRVFTISRFKNIVQYAALCAFGCCYLV
jgi:hypothetical protein